MLATKQIPAIRMNEGEILWQGIQLVMKISFAMAFIAGVYWVRRLFDNGFTTLWAEFLMNYIWFILDY